MDRLKIQRAYIHGYAEAMVRFIDANDFK